MPPDPADGKEKGPADAPAPFLGSFAA